MLVHRFCQRSASNAPGKLDKKQLVLLGLPPSGSA
jgi:hypothetical protein